MKTAMKLGKMSALLLYGDRVCHIKTRQIGTVMAYLTREVITVKVDATGKIGKWRVDLCEPIMGPDGVQNVNRSSLSPETTASSRPSPVEEKAGSTRTAQNLAFEPSTGPLARLVKAVRRALNL